MFGEPFKAGIDKCELVFLTQQRKSNPVGEVHHWPHRDWIADPDDEDRYRNITAYQDAQQGAGDGLKRYRQETADAANKHCKRQGVAVDVPQIRLEDEVTQKPQRADISQLFPGWKILLEIHITGWIVAIVINADSIIGDRWQMIGGLPKENSAWDYTVLAQPDLGFCICSVLAWGLFSQVAFWSGYR